MPAPADLACVTWNVHRTRGADGRCDAARIVATLADEVCVPAPDILVLTEADGERPPHAGLLDPAAVERATGLRHAHPPDLRYGSDSHGFLGSVLFLAPRLAVAAGDVLDLPGVAHRGAVAVELSGAAAPVRIVAAHLSLLQPLRIAQLRTLGQYLARRPAMPTILIGDLNEWRPWNGLAFSPRVLGTRFRGPVARTFPAALPLLPLDRIMASGAQVGAARVLNGPGLRVASDHLPLAATVRLAV